MIGKKLDKEKYREWLKNASIYDLLAGVASIEPDKTIKPVNFWKSEIANFLTNVQMFLRNPAKYPEDDLVRILFAVVMQKPYVVRFVKYMELQIGTALYKDLESMTRDAIKQLWGRPINFNDPNFLAWIVIFVMVGWEFAKRLELGNNPAGFNINNSTALSYYYSKKNSADSDRVKELNRQALGIDEDEELRKMLINDVRRISKSIKLNDLEKDSIVQEIFFRELEKRFERHFANLSGDELRSMAWGKENDFICLPNTVKKRAIDRLVKAWPRIRKIRERLKKAGKSEAEVKRITDLEWQRVKNSSNPYPVVITDKDYEDSFSVQYVSSDDEPEAKVAYKEERQAVIIELRKWSEDQASKVAKAVVGYLIENLDRLGEKKITNREIARKTGFHEDVIGRVRKRLRKEVPIIQNLLK